MMFSIIIPTRDRPRFLRRCLEALTPQLLPAKELAEVHVVDDCSGEKNREENRICAENHGCRYHYRKVTGGPAHARNTGIGRSQGEWVVFLDDDVIVEPGWYAALSEACKTAPPEVVGIEGVTRAVGEGIWDREVRNETGGLYLTTNIAYRKHILDDVGGFDETFKGPFCEDQELAVRMLRKGKVCFVPACSVQHLARDVRIGALFLRAPGRIVTLLRSELYFWLKHKSYYGRHRYASSFWRTYRDVVLKHVWICLKRRSFRQFYRHPLQTFVFVTASLIEQVCAVVYGPRLFYLYRKYVKMRFPAKAGTGGCG